MSLGKHYSMREAARVIGVHRETLKAWLVADLAMEFPTMTRGSRLMIREADLETVIRRRAPQCNFAKRRRLLESLHKVRTA